MECFFCGTVVDFKGRIEFRARCVKCDQPLHCCVNCKFYDAGAYNQCRESKAERVVEKKRSNHCEYFAPSEEKRGPSSGEDDSKNKFDQLFNI